MERLRMTDQPYVIWRFVAHDDEITRLIIAATCKTGGQVAHAEAIMRGGTIIGAFAEGGVQERSGGDTAWLPINGALYLTG
jgi:hypothetical protein